MFKPGDTISHPKWMGECYTVVSCGITDQIEYGRNRHFFVLHLQDLSIHHKFEWRCDDDFAKDLFHARKLSAVERKVAMMWSRQPYVKQAMPKV